MPTKRTMRGQHIDMTQLSGMNPDAIAVTAGGISMNAKGDILGPGGVVVKKAEQIQEEYNSQVSKSNQKISLADSNNMKKFAMKRKFMTPDEVQNNVKELEKEKERAKKLSDKVLATTEMMSQDEPKIVEHPESNVEAVQEENTTEKTRTRSRKIVDKED